MNDGVQPYSWFSLSPERFHFAWASLRASQRFFHCHGAGWYGMLPKSHVSPAELQFDQSSMPSAFACAASVLK